MDGLSKELECPPGTVMAVRRVRRINTADGFFTCIGCFAKSEVPDEDVARRLDVEGDIVPCISTRGISITIPERVHGNFLSRYVRNKNYFISKSAKSPTPIKRPRSVPQRPSTAGSRFQSSQKRSRRSPKSTPKSTSPPAIKSKEERKLELKEKLDLQVSQIESMEKKIATKVAGLNSVK